MDIHSGLTAVFEQHGNDYIAYIEEIPGVNTQGATMEEARANLLEALELTIEEVFNYPLNFIFPVSN